MPSSLLIKTFSAIVVVGTLSACAATPSRGRSTLSDVERASLGTVGIVSIASAPNTSFADPGFFKGAAKAAGDWVEFFGSGNGGYAALGAFLFPVAGLVGGIQAETNGLSSNDKNTIEAIFRNNLPEREAQNRLREHVRTHAMEDAKERLLDLGGASPTRALGYEVPLGRNVTTMLEVGLLQLMVTSAGEKDLDVRVRFTASARLLRVSDRRVLWSNSQFAQDIGSHKLSEFQGGSAALKRDIDNTLDLLARDIVNAAFLTGSSGAEFGTRNPDSDCSDP